LYKFRLHNQENEHTFITSISLLRKETGYTSSKVLELLKLMKRAKIINIESMSRWDYLLDQDGNIKDKDILIITAIDAISSFQNKDDEYYIYINLDLFKKYEESNMYGRIEKYIALYCLIAKWSNNTEQKMNMRIAKMAKILGFDKDFVHKMIYEMNRNYFMSSRKKNRKSGRYYFEHRLLTSTKKEDVEKFLSSEKENIEKLINRVEKKKNKKKVIDIEEELESSELVEFVEEMSNIKHGFGKKNNWGEDDLF
jgi:predicted transcriptional regulator